MKNSTLLSLMGVSAGLFSAAAVATVEVNFVDADNFTDFSDSRHPDNSGQKAYIKELTRFITDEVADRVSPHHHVTVVITDVDMAGEFELWRRGGFDDVRIIKDLYPPRINLSFRMVDAQGGVLREGNRRLRDLGFMHVVRPLDSDPLRYEKNLLDRWISREFRESAQA